MLKDPVLNASIDVVGAHYPGSAPPADGVGLHKPFWASEMWNLGEGGGDKGALRLTPRCAIGRAPQCSHRPAHTHSAPFIA